MATKVFCDGCNAEIEGAPTIMGHVVKQEYCEQCAETVKTYMAEVDQLHERLSAQWGTELMAIRGRYEKTLAALPDVVE